MDDQREPDHAEDPREQGTGQGYPESNPAETTPREGTDTGPEAGDEGADAPDTATGEEGEREQSTGHPGAAG